LDRNMCFLPKRSAFALDAVPECRPRAVISSGLSGLKKVQRFMRLRRFHGYEP
jgi:hypothetical protein